MNLSNCESVKGAFLKIMGFAGKRFLFSPPLPLPAPPVSVAIAPIFAPPKSEKCHERVGKPTETVATQANLVIKARRGARITQVFLFVPREARFINLSRGVRARIA